MGKVHGYDTLIQIFNEHITSFFQPALTLYADEVECAKFYFKFRELTLLWLIQW